MKEIILAVLFLFTVSSSFAQWTTSGANIYNSNSGNVGVGTTAPAAKLDILNTLTGPHSANSVLFRTVDGYNAGANGQFFQIIGAGDGTNYTNINLISNYGYLYFGARSDAAATPTNSLNILSNGYVGIGTTSPQTLLHIRQNTSDATGLIIQGNTFNTDNVQHYVAMTFDGDYGNATGNYSQIRSYSNLYTQWGSHLAFFTTQTGVANTLKERMRIDGNGNVGIGTTTPGTYKLAVNGGIHSQSVNVDLTGWSDYVFYPTYWLRPLSEVASYIKVNQHLPDVPSAQEVQKNGINFGETNALLLKKIEELTLYLIEKDKQIQNQQIQLSRQQQTNQSLQEQINNLSNVIKNQSSK